MMCDLCKLSKKLSKSQEIPYIEWARENYTVGDPVGMLWHPVVKNECRIMNEEYDVALDKMYDEIMNES